MNLSTMTEAYRSSSSIVLQILDWFNDPDFEYINHILVSKLDGEERIRRALPLISKHCAELVRSHANTPAAYPVAS